MDPMPRTNQSTESLRKAETLGFKDLIFAIYRLAMGLESPLGLMPDEDPDRELLAALVKKLEHVGANDVGRASADRRELAEIADSQAFLGTADQIRGALDRIVSLCGRILRLYGGQDKVFMAGFDTRVAELSRSADSLKLAEVKHIFASGRAIGGIIDLTLRVAHLCRRMPKFKGNYQRVNLSPAAIDLQAEAQSLRVARERLGGVDVSRLRACSNVIRQQETICVRLSGSRKDMIDGARAWIERLYPAEPEPSAAAWPAPEVVNWQILPPGTLDSDRLEGWLAELRRRWASKRYDEGRMRLMYSLGPKATYTGIGEFDGYMVFTFEHTGKAVLDNPLVGNAVYIFSGNWRVLSRMTKRELIEEHRESTVRVVHSGDWFAKVRRALLYR